MGSSITLLADKLHNEREGLQGTSLKADGVFVLLLLHCNQHRDDIKGLMCKNLQFQSQNYPEIRLNTPPPPRC